MLWRMFARSGPAPESARQRGGAHLTGPLLALTLLFALLVPAPAHALTYFVDNASVNASPSGPGTKAQPYSTIGAALAAHPDSGAVFVVKAGVYRERVLINASGTGPKPIVLQADSGAAVVVDGADDFSRSEQWVLAGGNVWLAAGVNWPPVQVFADGARLAPSAQAAPDVEPGGWLYVAGSGLYVNLNGDSPALHQAAVGRRSGGFFVQGASHLRIEGFHVTRTESKGIELIGASHVVVSRNRVDQCGSGGIAAEGGLDLQVSGNVVSDNQHHGILFRDGVTGSVIDGNESFANFHLGESWATGIYLAGSPDNVIEGNRLHDNQDSGCEVQTGSNDCVLRRNVSWANGDHGFSHLYASGTISIGNVAWGNRHEAFSIQGNATGTKLYNCIGLDRALETYTYCMLVDSSSTAGFDADYNVMWNTVGGAAIRFGNSIYANAAAFQAATGIGPHTVQADPRFSNPANGDFHLLADSPAIDDATSAAPGWTAVDAAGVAPQDDPDVPNAGGGPFAFADRGAFEFQGGVLSVGGRPRPTGLALASAFPNPGTRSVAFTLVLGAAADVTCSVFDLQGREVWSQSGARPAGSSTLSWSLTDRSGARVPSGMYLARVSRGGESAVLRFVVMK